MNLAKLLEMQRRLDERIIKEKGLEGQDLFPNTVLALQVELSEFANEGRWFKHWSNDQDPRTIIEYICPTCNGTGDENYDSYIDDLEGGYTHEVINCEDCGGTGTLGYKNPLLEEFADGLHFFLSIANQKGWQEALWIYEEQLDPSNEFDGGLTGIFLEMLYFLNKSCMERHPSDEKIAGFQTNEYFFRMAWILFLNIGINGFGFTFDQIEEAYMKKNAVNHERQESGY
jgi:dimeric dUTPase (all-alpha-NTP-PPase superfamily)